MADWTMPSPGSIRIIAISQDYDMVGDGLNGKQVVSRNRQKSSLCQYVDRFMVAERIAANHIMRDGDMVDGYL